MKKYIKDNGNFMVEDMMKAIKDFNIMKSKGSSDLQKENAKDDKDNILYKIGLYPETQTDCKQIVENILDNGTSGSTPKQCMEYLEAERDLDLPDKKDFNKKATADMRLTYDLQDANDIVANVANYKYFEAISDKLNYLDLVDGDYLGKLPKDYDAMYFNSTKKLATVKDVYDEYTHAINYIKNTLIPKINAHNASLKSNKNPDEWTIEYK